MKKQNFIITSLFLFWVIGTTTAQTITGKVTNIHAQAIDGATGSSYKPLILLLWTP